MAFSVDQASLGTGESGQNVTSFTITTTGAVAAGGLIIVGGGNFNSSSGTNNITVSGGSLTWTTAVQNSTALSADTAFLAWALAPSGLASSTVLTIQDSVANGLAAACVGIMSFLGAVSSSPTDGTSTKNATAGNPWSGNAIATTGSSDLVVGVGWGDGNTSSVTDTPTSPWTAGPLKSDSGTNGGVAAIVYQMNVASGNYSPGGTWAGTVVPTSTATVGAGFKAAGAAAGIPDLIMAPMHR